MLKLISDTFVHQRLLLRKQKYNLWNERKYLGTMYLIRLEYSKSEKTSYNSATTERLVKGEDLNRHFLKVDLQMDKKHMKWCWT